MAVEINGKVYRNLPEQVLKNQEDINSLKDAIVWGNITGNISNQTDLVNALQAKQNASNAVTTNGTQTITGEKTFTTDTYFTGTPHFNTTAYLSECYCYGSLYSAGNLDLGSASYKWRDLYLYRSLRDGNNANYGLVLPNTTSFTANKTIATTDECGTKLYKHTLRFSKEVGPDEYENMDIDIVSIRGTPYSVLSTITSDKNYEVLSYGYIQPEDMPKQVIGFEDTGMDSFLIYYLDGGQIENIEIEASGFVSDTVTAL